MLDYDVANIKGSRVGDVDTAEMVKCIIAGGEYHEGKVAPTSSSGYTFFNTRLQSKIFGPALRSAAYAGDVRKTAEVLEKLGNLHFPLDSPTMRGASGQTPVHAAAAGGHVEIVQLLLLRMASLNAQDLDGETPLHYAALAGKPTVTNVLLRMGADHSVESYLGQTPAEVARESPADFLGFQSRDALEILDKNRHHNNIKALETENHELRRRLGEAQKTLDMVQEIAEGSPPRVAVQLILDHLRKGGALRSPRHHVTCSNGREEARSGIALQASRAVQNRPSSGTAQPSPVVRPSVNSTRLGAARPVDGPPIESGGSGAGAAALFESELTLDHIRSLAAAAKEDAPDLVHY